MDCGLDSLATSNPIQPFTVHTDKINAILDNQIVLTNHGEIQHFLVRWINQHDSNFTWIFRETLQQLDPNLLELYRSQHDLSWLRSPPIHSGRVVEDTKFRPPLARFYTCRKKLVQPLSLWLGV